MPNYLNLKDFGLVWRDVVLDTFKRARQTRNGTYVQQRTPGSTET